MISSATFSIIHYWTKSTVIGRKSKTMVEVLYFDDIAEYVKGHACPHDIILTMGAGTIFEVGRKILE